MGVSGQASEGGGRGFQQTPQSSLLFFPCCKFSPRCPYSSHSETSGNDQDGAVPPLLPQMYSAGSLESPLHGMAGKALQQEGIPGARWELCRQR